MLFGLGHVGGGASGWRAQTAHAQKMCARAPRDDIYNGFYGNAAQRCQVRIPTRIAAATPEWRALALRRRTSSYITLRRVLMMTGNAAAMLLRRNRNEHIAGVLAPIPQPQPPRPGTGSR